MKKLIVRIAEGLGNQLFMYSNGLALAKENNYDLYVDNTSGYFKKKNQFRAFELDKFILLKDAIFLLSTSSIKNDFLYLKKSNLFLIFLLISR